MKKIYIDKYKNDFSIMQKDTNTGMFGIDFELSKHNTEQKAIAEKDRLVKTGKYIFIGFDY